MSTRFLRILAVTAVSLGTLGMAGCSASDDTTGAPRECTSSGAEALKVCSTGATVKGVDVSKYQGTVSWSQVKAGGNGFAIARVSDGLSYPDSYFATNWGGIKSAGLVRGVYQFFRPGQDPVQQADLLISKVNAAGGLEAGDLAPVLDIEVTDSVASATVVARAKTWLQHVESVTGRKPIVYTAAFMSSVLGTGFGGYPLWVANYGTTCPTMPAGWSSWKIWQYSSTGAVSGISGSVDVNHFNGTLQDLVAFAGATPAPTNADAGTTPPDNGGTESEPFSGTIGGGAANDGSEGLTMGEGFKVSAVLVAPTGCN